MIFSAPPFHRPLARLPVLPAMPALLRSTIDLRPRRGHAAARDARGVGRRGHRLCAECADRARRRDRGAGARLRAADLQGGRTVEVGHRHHPGQRSALQRLRRRPPHVHQHRRAAAGRDAKRDHRRDRARGRPHRRRPPGSPARAACPRADHGGHLLAARRRRDGGGRRYRHQRPCVRPAPASWPAAAKRRGAACSAISVPRKRLPTSPRSNISRRPDSPARECLSRSSGSRARCRSPAPRSTPIRSATRCRATVSPTSRRW